MAAPTLAEMRTRVRERGHFSANEILFTDAIVNRRIQIEYRKFLMLQPNGWWWQHAEQTLQNLTGADVALFPVSLASPDGKAHTIRKVYAVFASLDGDYWLPIPLRERTDQVRFAGGRTVGDGLPLAWSALPIAGQGAAQQFIYWKLDEAAGPTATDSSGNGRDGTYGAGSTFSQASLRPDNLGSAVRFTGGATQRVTSTATFGPTSYPLGFTMAVRLKVLVNPATQFSVARLGTVTNPGIQISVLSTGQIQSQFNGPAPGFTGYPAGTFPTVIGTPYWVVVRFDGNVLSLYVDGVLILATAVPEDPFIPAGSTFRVGAAPNNDAADVVVDDFAFYDRPLTPEQIQGGGPGLAIALETPLPATAWLRYLCVVGPADLIADNDRLVGLPSLVADAVVERATAVLLRQRRAVGSVARRSAASAFAAAEAAAIGWERAARTYLTAAAAGPSYMTLNEAER